MISFNTSKHKSEPQNLPDFYCPYGQFGLENERVLVSNRLNSGFKAAKYLSYRFYATRWKEDEAVAEKALKLWTDIVKFVKHCESLCKSKRTQNKSYENLTKHQSDKFIPLMLQFFKDV